MNFIIKRTRDVTVGGAGGCRKCISFNGELPIVDFEIPAAPQLSRTLFLRKVIENARSLKQLLAMV